jgi:hypothetical protein
MSKERVLVTVKTYPTLSRKYGETVCTAGVREDGTWVRIYPVPFRRLDEKEQYRKFEWLECQLVRNPSDPRPETFRPVDENELEPVGFVDTKDGWRERRRILLETARVYDRLDDLIAGAKANLLSLAVFKPTRVLDFVVEEETREWDRACLGVRHGLGLQTAGPSRRTTVARREGHHRSRAAASNHGCHPTRSCREEARQDEQAVGALGQRERRRGRR